MVAEVLAAEVLDAVGAVVIVKWKMSGNFY